MSSMTCRGVTGRRIMERLAERQSASDWRSLRSSQSGAKLKGEVEGLNSVQLGADGPLQLQTCQAKGLKNMHKLHEAKHCRRRSC
mmetsp:Transcript_18479/g.43286  ORF Transcript_18479/g.43286 Transcript_18479/m.43286 type:complete len:85 (+) Transcript_18479:100-354(+)